MFDEYHPNQEPLDSNDGGELRGSSGFEPYHASAQQSSEQGEDHKAEITYTPPANTSFIPGYQDYGYNDYQNQDQYQYAPNAPVQSSDAQGGSGSAGRKKKTRHITLGTVVAATIASAIIASGATSTIFLYMNHISEDNTNPIGGTSTPQSYTTINVESTAASITEAIAQKVTPSVVGVKVTTTVNNIFWGSQSQVGEGSGIIYRSDGYIITNYHVIQDAVESNGTLEVFLQGDVETAIPAQVIGYDITADLAVIKINQTGLTPIEIGSSADLKVGQTAVAVGNPGGLEYMGSVSAGIISGLNRSVQLENMADMQLIQTDAAINPGNSGGALVDDSGKLIGVNSAKMGSSSSANYEGMGFAIPVDSVVEICDRIINNQDEPKTYLGLEISTYYDSDTLNRMGYPSGVVVYSVTEDGPAAEAGIQKGDIITHFNGTAITSYALYNSEKDKCSPGDTVQLTVYRQGKTYQVNVVLAAATS